jgi:hypothetical protein
LVEIDTPVNPELFFVVGEQIARLQPAQLVPTLFWKLDLPYVDLFLPGIVHTGSIFLSRVTIIICKVRSRFRISCLNAYLGELQNPNCVNPKRFDPRN